MVSIKDISKAQISIAKHTVFTPLIFSNSLSMQLSRKVFFKCESFQRTGSFKIRGAVNRFLQLSPEEKSRGVVTPCYGNHGQAAAVAASIVDCKLTAIMPTDSSILKTDYVRQHGAEIVLHGKSFEESASFARKWAKTHGQVLFHPYEDMAALAGAGTVGLEILEQNPDTEAIVIPVGGGALLSGIATTIKEKKSKAAIIGVQPQNCSPFYKAYHSKNDKTVSETTSVIADALNISSVSSQNHEIAQKYVDDLLVIPEEELVSAIISMVEQSHLVVEGAGAVTLAAVLQDMVPSKYRNVTLLISGGNIDSAMLSKIIHHGLSKRRRIVRLEVLTQDCPGQLERLTSLFDSKGINIIQVYQSRFLAEATFGQTRVQLVVEAKGADHEFEIKALLNQEGFSVAEFVKTT